MLQHLPGLSIKEIRAAKHKAASDTEAVIEEAEPLIQVLEDQNLENEEAEGQEVFDNVNDLADSSGCQHGDSSRALGLPPNSRTDSTRPLLGSLEERLREERLRDKALDWSGEHSQGEGLGLEPPAGPIFQGGQYQQLTQREVPGGIRGLEAAARQPAPAAALAAASAGGGINKDPGQEDSTQRPATASGPPASGPSVRPKPAREQLSQPPGPKQRKPLGLRGGNRRSAPSCKHWGTSCKPCGPISSIERTPYRSKCSGLKPRGSPYQGGTRARLRSWKH